MQRSPLLFLGVVTALAAPAAGAAGELVFHPLAPCRLVDTRVSGGILAADTTRSYTFHGLCGIPGLTNDGGAEANQAVALALNFVAVGAQGAGHLTAWPANQPMPTASVINYTEAGHTLANGVILPLCDQVEAPPCVGGDVSVRAAVSSTHLVIDVTGYFAKPMRANSWRNGAGGIDNFLCIHGSIKLGLTHKVAQFAVAGGLCPAGTWLCSRAERGTVSCNTTRADSSCDALDCAGNCVSFPADQQYGWVRDDAASSATHEVAIGEIGTNSVGLPSCSSYPAWCCSAW